MKKILLAILILATSTLPIMAKRIKARRNAKLSNKGITDVSNFRFRKTVRRIDLSNNEIKDISELSIPTKLRRLDISTNPVETIGSFAIPSRLRVLFFSDTKITGVDTINALIRNSSLTSFALASSPNASVENLIFPETLTDLSLFEDELTDLRMQALALTSNLKFLSVRINKITNPDSIRYPPNLEELFISDNPIDTSLNFKFPDSLKLLSLSDTNLDNNELTELNGKLSNNLEILFLSQNNISDASNFILPNTIKDLGLSFNAISDVTLLPDLSATQLERLAIDFNPISSVQGLVVPDSLRTIIISAALLEDNDIDDIIAALPRKIRRVNLARNFFSRRGRRRLRRAFPRAKFEFKNAFRF